MLLGRGSGSSFFNFMEVPMPELWEQHIGIAKKAAVKYCRTRPHLNLDDVIQECLVVLYKSSLNYTPAKGHFGRYAKVSIDFHLLGFWKGHLTHPQPVSSDEPVRSTEDGDEVTRADVHDKTEGRAEAHSRASDHELSRIAEVQQFIKTGETLTALERDVLRLHFLDDVLLDAVAARLKQSFRDVQIARVSGLKKLRAHFQEKGFEVSTDKIKTHPSDQREDSRERAQLRLHNGFHVKRGTFNPDCQFCTA